VTTAVDEHLQSEIMPLYGQGSDRPTLFWVPETNTAYRTLDQALHELRQTLVCDCGQAKKQRYDTRCPACEQKARAERERQLFERAEKVNLSEFDPEFVEWADYSSTEEFYEAMVELAESGEELPTYVWCCKASTVVHLDLERVLENAEQDPYEDFDYRELNGLPELERALEAFNQTNVGNARNVSWGHSRKCAAILDRKFLEELYRDAEVEFKPKDEHGRERE
jgi:hypothetical protein